ncbi:MAG: universal stress protein [Deltaproteobacteria bacterium]|nr:universal stress protein [Deltaproteobacteria bacterium]MBW2176155.1 universal stress protein [Deltaproteobacteria bacterium]MBW2297213.1 universal stress protein [Deltaproteobacteria bacterium]MBW2633201.1 universal stress protein [Deltaproteobacteria bacterium]MBW2676450.1 universal stress protein [Deltaproteobacteria bacterium]
MFKKILFATSATEASDHAARVAFNMALNYKAHISIFHVMGVPTRGFSQVVLDVKTREEVVLDDEYVAWVEEEVKTYYAKQLETAENFDIKVAIGFPHREILREARQSRPDLIVLGGSTGEPEESVYKRGMVGSTLQRVAKAAPCPVLVVNRPAASFWGGMSNIVFGTDFSKASDAAFEFACKFAKALGCEMHIFHALDISTMHMGRMLTQDEIETRIRESLRRIRGKYISKIKGEIQDYAFDVWEGVPYVEVVKYAREKHADLIVMAHHNRKTSEEDNRLGSNIEQVIVRAGCPVISVNKQVRN